MSVQQNRRPLWDFQAKLGNLIHLDSPALILEVLKRVQLSGTPGDGAFIEAGFRQNAKTLEARPVGTIERELSPFRRLVLCASRRAFVGQKLQVDAKNRFGFERFMVRLELQGGLDLGRKRSFISGELDAYKIKPLWHPAVLGGVAAVYMALFHFRNPLRLTVNAKTLSVRGKALEVQPQVSIQRFDNNVINTTALKGVLLTLRL